MVGKIEWFDNETSNNKIVTMQTFMLSALRAALILQNKDVIVCIPSKI